MYSIYKKKTHTKRENTVELFGESMLHRQTTCTGKLQTYLLSCRKPFTTVYKNESNTFDHVDFPLMMVKCKKIK